MDSGGCIIAVPGQRELSSAFSGQYVSSNMSGTQIFNTLSAGIAFTGIAAGFVEEMVFRGVILNVLKKKWNIKRRLLSPRYYLVLCIFWG